MNNKPNRDENREEKNMTNASRGSDVSDHPFRGTVINEFGKPLSKACVSLIGATVASVRTDASGAFAIPRGNTGENPWLEVSAERPSA